LFSVRVAWSSESFRPGSLSAAHVRYDDRKPTYRLLVTIELGLITVVNVIWILL